MQDVADLTATAPPKAEVIFTVSRRALWSARLPALAMAAAALWICFLPSRIEGGESPSTGVVAMFWIGLALALAVALALIWVQWRKVPSAARAGVLQIGPDGVIYAVGPDGHSIPWDRITAIHPVRRVRGSAPIAVWLSGDLSTDMTLSREHVLAAAVHRSPYRPVARPDGLLLPLRLFGRDRADAIIATLQQYQVAARSARPAP